MHRRGLAAEPRLSRSRAGRLSLGQHAGVPVPSPFHPDGKKICSLAAMKHELSTRFEMLRDWPPVHDGATASGEGQTGSRAAERETAVLVSVAQSTGTVRTAWRKGFSVSPRHDGLGGLANRSQKVECGARLAAGPLGWGFCYMDFRACWWMRCPCCPGQTRTGKLATRVAAGCVLVSRTDSVLRRDFCLNTGFVTGTTKELRCHREGCGPMRRDGSKVRPREVAGVDGRRCGSVSGVGRQASLGVVPHTDP